MSYVDTGDDELDYGEGELGDGTTAGVSLGAPADEDEMAQEDEYEELYDDVNIGYLEAPAVAMGDGYATMVDMDMMDHKPDGGAAALKADPDTRAMEQTQLEATLTTATPKLSEAPIELAKGIKIELKEEIKDERGVPTAWSKESTENGKDVVQGRQMQLFLSPTIKDQGSGYINGVRQGSLHGSEKSYSPYNTKTDLASGNGENPVGSATAASLAQSGGHPGSSFTAGSGRVAGGASENFKDRGGEDDMSYDRNPGSATGASRSAQRDLPYSMADNASRQQMVSDRPAPQQQYSGEGSGMLFVGDLQWWTTDAELEAALSEYGRVKNLKFYEERVSGKSKGYCQVEFFDHASAVACKQGMNGRKFHGRPCIVALGNAKSIQQMGFQQEKKIQAQFQAQQEQMSTRRASGNTTGGTRGGSYQDRDGGRGYGRARTGQGMGSKTGQGGGGRGRGSYMTKGMGGGGGGSGGSGGSGMPYGQGHSGPMGGHQTAMMMHQGMMGQGYDAPYGPMGGRGGAAYGGYVMPGPPFPGMVAPFPGMGPGGLPAVAPHVNPAFFGRPNGMGLMPGSGMEGPHQGMWGDGSMVGWGGEEHDRRAGYAEDGGSMDYNYNSDLGHEKSRIGGGWDKENGGLIERHRRDDRDGEWERDLYKEKERDIYRDQRDRDRYRDKDDDWDRERTAKTRNRSRIFDEDDDPRLRSREDDYGRKRRITERELSSM